MATEKQSFRWSNKAWKSSPPFTQAHLEAIAQSLELSPPLASAYVYRLQEAAKEFLLKRHIAAKPLVSQNRKNLERLYQTADAFAQALAQVDDSCLQRVERSWSGGWEYLETLTERLPWIRQPLHHVLASLPAGVGGRPDDWPLDDYIRCLGPLFKDIIGKEPTSGGYDPSTQQGTGAFVAFVTACLRPLDPKDPTLFLDKPAYEALPLDELHTLALDRSSSLYKTIERALPPIPHASHSL